MYFKDKPTPAFVEEPAFKVPSTSSMRDVELGKLLGSNESGKSYPNL